MKLAKLDITYFRCFESLSVSLQPDVNVFVGVNGAGKSTILDAIAISLYHVINANGGGGKRQRGWQKVVLQPSDIHMVSGTEEPTSRRKDFVHFRATAKDFYPVSGFPAKTSLDAETLLEWDDEITFQPPNTFKYDNNWSSKLAYIYNYFRELWEQIRTSPDGLIPLPTIAYYRSSRRSSQINIGSDVFKLNMERHGAFENALDAGTSYENMSKWFYLRENQELREKIQTDNNSSFEFNDLKAVRKAISTILNDVKQVFFSSNPPRLMARIQNSSAEESVFELGQLSDGYQNLLALVMDFARRLAQAHPNWENPLEAPGILLIDEIDLHLHPKWQQEIIPNLRRAFPNTQLMVTTHSPQVLTTVAREKIQVLNSKHELKPLPSDIGTLGAESSQVLEEVFGTNIRPANVASVQNLRVYLKMVEAGKARTPEAIALRQNLENDLGQHDNDLLTSDLRASQLEMLKRA
jgi:predicted ATP-binding protein involved in virulence